MWVLLYVIVHHNIKQIIGIIFSIYNGFYPNEFGCFAELATTSIGQFVTCLCVITRVTLFSELMTAKSK